MTPLHRTLRPLSERRPMKANEEPPIQAVNVEGGAWKPDLPEGRYDEYELDQSAPLYFDDTGEVWARLNCKVSDLPRQRKD